MTKLRQILNIHKSVFNILNKDYKSIEKINIFYTLKLDKPAYIDNI